MPLPTAYCLLDFIHSIRRLRPVRLVAGSARGAGCTRGRAEIVVALLLRRLLEIVDAFESGFGRRDGIGHLLVAPERERGLEPGPQRGRVLVEWRVVRIRTRAFDGLDLGPQRLRARAEIFHRFLVRLGWLFIG